MSFFDCPQASSDSAAEEAGVAQVIVPRTADLGGFEVARALPSRERRTVGPFVFLDQMGLGVFAPGKGLDVRPHPHIGLSTVTYLYSGELLHRDSLDTRQTIRPGAVNWMTAGRGIAHSERTPERLREAGSELFGLQAWVALPEKEEECAPEFVHHPAESLPSFSDRGLRGRVLAGSAFGETSPVARADELFYVDLALDAGTSVMIEPSHDERAVFVAIGEIRIDAIAHAAGRLLVLEPGQRVPLEAVADSRIAVLGGDPLDGPRHVWWNFVSSRRDRIEQAKADWQAGRFDRVIDENEWIPLPTS